MYVLSEKIAINYIEGCYKRNVCDMKYVCTINNWIFWENLDMLHR